MEEVNKNLNDEFEQNQAHLEKEQKSLEALLLERWISFSK